MVDISGLDYRECHVQCRWQRVTEYVQFDSMRVTIWISMSFSMKQNMNWNAFKTFKFLTEVEMK